MKAPSCIFEAVNKRNAGEAVPAELLEELYATYVRQNRGCDGKVRRTKTKNARLPKPKSKRARLSRRSRCSNGS